MQGFDSENNSDEEEEPIICRSNTEPTYLIPLKFVPVLKPKKSCQVIKNFNLKNVLEEIENLKYFSDDEIRNLNRKNHYILHKRKEHSLVNNKTNELFNKESNRNGFCIRNKNQGKSQSCSLLENHFKKEKQSIYLSLQKKKEMKDK